ncbi:TIGR01777 family oxidoreductase [Flavobacterium azooxidireducens]|uniref:TIGR01777 family oxidoreductase n=1 Tax=Flavobacterium azooxidireducens TaxID=1871076 RepID=A0ABY4KCI0_9FLAO|nr:TIGR01777 family oxidoreductase [Flavobacterium azooxidireducens]UPQ78492.1 TIGR01777 family oxidoreductase [Flavobacterium azooxidireducens]
MKILITGATGLVGKELIALLLEKGNEIHYLTTSQSKIESKPHYQGFYWNPDQSIIDENCLMGVDAIIHLAGATVSKRWTTNYKQEIIESRTLSSNLLYTCLKNHPNQVKQIVSASAIGIYPDSLNHIYTEENKSIDDGFLGHVVMKWEESVDVFSRLNIKVCKLRTGLVLSKKGGALTEMLKPIKIGLGSPFGSGKQVQSWIHVEDLAAMYFFAVQNQWEGVFNGVAPNPVTNAELTKAIAKTINKPLFMPNIPKFAMKLVLGEMHELLFSSQNVSSAKAEKNGFQFRYRDLAKTLDNLLS